MGNSNLIWVVTGLGGWNLYWISAPFTPNAECSWYCTNCRAKCGGTIWFSPKDGVLHSSNCPRPSRVMEEHLSVLGLLWQKKNHRSGSLQTTEIIIFGTEKSIIKVLADLLSSGVYFLIYRWCLRAVSSAVLVRRAPVPIMRTPPNGRQRLEREPGWTVHTRGSRCGPITAGFPCLRNEGQKTFLKKIYFLIKLQRGCWASDFEVLFFSPFSVDWVRSAWHCCKQGRPAAITICSVHLFLWEKKFYYMMKNITFLQRVSWNISPEIRLGKWIKLDFGLDQINHIQFSPFLKTSGFSFSHHFAFFLE